MENEDLFCVGKEEGVNRAMDGVKGEKGAVNFPVREPRCLPRLRGDKGASRRTSSHLYLRPPQELFLQNLSSFSPGGKETQIYLINKDFYRAYSLQGTVPSTTCILSPSSITRLCTENSISPFYRIGN